MDGRPELLLLADGGSDAGAFKEGKVKRGTAVLRSSRTAMFDDG